MGALADGEQDEFKRVLLEGNPLFLGLTMVVSMLHSVFDMLAFKNDIGFWKNKKNVEGKENITKPNHNIDGGKKEKKRKVKFPCNICKDDYITHLFPKIQCA